VGNLFGSCHDNDFMNDDAVFVRLLLFGRRRVESPATSVSFSLNAFVLLLSKYTKDFPSSQLVPIPVSGWNFFPASHEDLAPS
jgi:hypothetical protein